ncbi:MAG: hypothetical protein AABY22_16960 [Nanoarchaeota archaeon]
MSRVLTCVYCGMEYPQETPSCGDKVLTDHIKVCKKHPMRKLEIENVKLREALVYICTEEKVKDLLEDKTSLEDWTYNINCFLNTYYTDPE